MPAKLIYHVAVTLDGRIAHHDGSYDGLSESGPHVDAFMEAVSGCAAVLMGRKTYEVGLAAGLALGQPAYPGRPNYVFSGTLPRPETRSSELHVVNTESVRLRCGAQAALRGQHLAVRRRSVGRQPHGGRVVGRVDPEDEPDGVR